MPPDCEVHDVAGLPTIKIHKLAEYAKTASKEFRKDACKRGNFEKTINDILKDNPDPPFDCLSREEVVFCEGWIYLAENEFRKADGEVDDDKLLTAIKKHVPDDAIVPFTG